MKAESVIKLSRALGLSCDYILLGKSNRDDLDHLLKPAEDLNENQIKCLEEIIKTFVCACTSKEE